MKRKKNSMDKKKTKEIEITKGKSRSDIKKKKFLRQPTTEDPSTPSSSPSTPPSFSQHLTTLTTFSSSASSSPPSLQSSGDDVEFPDDSNYNNTTNHHSLNSHNQDIPSACSLRGIVGPHSPLSLVREQDVVFQFSDPKILQIDQYYLRAVDCDPDDSTTLYDYAMFTTKCGRATDRSEEYFLRSLEANPFNLRCLESYGTFLKEKMKLEIGDQFRLRSSYLAQATHSLRATKGETMHSTEKREDVMGHRYRIRTMTMM